jgi:hypothetical protein
MTIRHGLALAVVACAFAIAGCGGGGGGGTSAAVSQSGGGGAVVPAAPTPSPTPTPGPLSLTTSSLQFSVAGQVQPFTANEPGYFGTFTATSLAGHSCSGIASVSPATIVGPNPTFSVTAVAAGKCVFVVTDAYGQTAQAAVFVTTTTGSVSVHDGT